jgi:hypothetical protein
MHGRPRRIKPARKEIGVYCPNRECPDFLDDGKPGEYLETITVCPKCGAQLVPELPAADPSDLDFSVGAPSLLATGRPAEPPVATPAAAGPLVALAGFERPEDSEPLMADLATAGIQAYQFFDDGRDFEDPGDYPVCTRVLVPDSQATLAARVLEWANNNPGP